VGQVAVLVGQVAVLVGRAAATEDIINE